MPYTFHLTTTVYRDGSPQFRAYKLESLRISAEQPGFEWVVLVRAGGEEEHWYSLSGWASEAALDAAGSTPAMTDCIERHEPYRYMVTKPAFREVADPIHDDPGRLDAATAVHTTFDVRAGEALADFADWARRGAEPGVARRIVLQVKEQPTRFYAVDLLTAGAEHRANPPSELLASEPAVRTAELLLVA